MRLSTESTRHHKTQGFEAVGRLILEATPGQPVEAEWLGKLAEVIGRGPKARARLLVHLQAELDKPQD